MTSRAIIDCFAIGQVFRQTIVTTERKVHERIPGGPGLYACAAMRAFSEHVGLITTVPDSENNELYRLLDRFKIDQNGVIVDPTAKVADQFIGYLPPDGSSIQQAIPYFSSIGLPLPASLRSGDFIQPPDSRLVYFPTALSPDYRYASTAYICAAPLDLQIKAITLLDKAAISVLSVLSDPAYMIPSNWDKIMNLVNGLTVFVTTSQQLNSLFKNRTGELDEMCQVLKTNGLTYLVIIDKAKEYQLCDLQAKKKISVPQYPAKLVDPTGMEEAFCGGLVAGLRRNQNPVEAVLFGSVIASIKSEGCGPFYPLDVTPGLIEARIAHIQDWVKHFE